MKTVAMILLIMSCLFANQAYANSSLVDAINQGKTTEIISLINSGADIHQKDPQGRTPLSLVILTSNTYGKFPEKIRLQLGALLLKNGANPNYIDKYGNSLLHAATGEGILQMRLLLGAGVNPNIQNKEGETPLHEIRWDDHRKFKKISLLMEHDADITIKNNKGELPQVISNITGIKKLKSAFSEALRKYAISFEYGRDYSDDLDKVTLFFIIGLKPDDILEEMKVADPSVFTYPMLNLLKTHDLKLSNIPNALHKAVYVGDLDAVKLLIKQGTDVNSLNESDGKTRLFYYKNNRTPLFYSALSDSPYRKEIATFLLENGADLNAKDKNENNAFSLSFINEDASENLSLFLLEKGSDFKQSQKGITLLNAAVASGKLKVLKALIVKGMDIKQLDNNNHSLLHFAVKEEQADIVSYLLKQGLDANHKDKDGNTALFYSALYKRSPELASLLLAHEADINAINNKQETALHLAAQSNNTLVASLLLEKGTNINAKTKDGTTPLLLAVKKKEKEIAKLLIYKGADKSIQNDKQQSPEKIAAEKGMDVASLFTVKDFDPATETKLLFQAVEKDDINKIGLFLARGAKLSALNENGQTLLFVSSYPKTIEFLIARGLDIGTKDKNVKTAIQIHFEEKGWRAIKTLLHHGADGRIKNNKNESLLQVTLNDSGPHDEIIGMLIQQINNLNASCSAEQTYWRSLQNNKTLIKYYKLLFSNGLNPNATTDKHQRTLLHRSVSRDSTKPPNNEIASLAIEYKADVNAQDDLGWAPLHYAVSVNNTMGAKILIDAYAKQDIKDDIGFSPLDYASLFGLKEIQMLFSEPPSLSKVETQNTSNTQDTNKEQSPDKYGRTELHKAVYQGEIEKIKKLLNSGVVVDVKDRLGRTPLHYAASTGSLDVAKLLLGKGAEINRLDTSRQWTPLFFAYFMGRAEMTEYLLANGADATVKDKSGKLASEYIK